MPIIDLQQRLRQLGRIRAGETVETKSGSRRPAKLDHFRITSHSRRIVEQVAELYGGEVRPWTPNNGTAEDAQWEVTVTADRLPILLPPQSISQWYELWSGGGALRRCDGEQEKISGQRCLCDPDPAKRQCAVTTRLSVILREVEGLGVFRLDSKGFYAAAELPQIAAFLEYAGSYVEAHLALEPRKDVKDGKTRHWLTPVLDVDITPAALLAGGTAAGAIAAGRPREAVTPPEQRTALPGGPPSGVAPPEGVVIIDPETLAERVAECETPDELRALWGEVSGRDKLLQQPANADAAALFTRRAEELVPPAERENGTAPAADTSGGKPPPEPEVPADPEIERLWNEIQNAAPKTWTSDQLDADFEASIGVATEDATAAHMQAYLDISNQGGTVVSYTITETYEQVSATARRYGRCPECGTRVTRSRTFTQTVNPFNRHAGGAIKTPAEVRAVVQADADLWQPTGHDLLHEACAVALSPEDYESYREQL